MQQKTHLMRSHCTHCLFCLLEEIDGFLGSKSNETGEGGAIVEGKCIARTIQQDREAEVMIEFVQIFDSDLVRDYGSEERGKVGGSELGL